MGIYPVGLQHFLLLGTILFCIGMYGALSRRNAIGILLSIELMLNGVAVLFVAFSRYITSDQDLAGQMFAIFIITQAAAGGLRARCLRDTPVKADVRSRVDRVYRHCRRVVVVRDLAECLQRRDR